MRGTRFEFWFATTAIVLIAAGSSLPVQSAPLTEAEISAAVPMPEPANLPPPTAADIARPHVSPTPAAPARAAAPTAVPNSTQPAAAPTVAAPEIATPPVTAPAVAPAEAPVLTIDQRVAEKLRDLFGGRSDRIIDRKTKAAIEAYYAARSYAPIWVDNGAESARGKAAAAHLARVDADGLDPSDYPVPSFMNADAGALAEAELKFTATVLTYARHAQIGRVHYSRVSSDIFYDLVAPEPGAVLAKLADVRGHAGGARHTRISFGPNLKPGMEDPRVPLLRDRLGVAGTATDTT